MITGGGELTTYRPGPPMMALSLGPHAGVAFTPRTDRLGAEATVQAKSSTLRTSFYEELFGLTARLG
ncbi:hypothetical protein ACLMAL_09190 [Nocardia sp. CWNU-33]|uniref:hypothetical protein n=1 Tax=Nocardia sp. CWNU-33 TaxID=3392117 RepID=UPI00398EF20B